MDIGMRHGLMDLVKNISTNIAGTDDPEVVSSTIPFLMEHRQYDKAVEMMIQLGNLDEALVTAEKYQVSLSEDMANKLTPPTTQDPMKQQER